MRPTPLDHDLREQQRYDLAQEITEQMLSMDFPGMEPALRFPTLGRFMAWFVIALEAYDSLLITAKGEPSRNGKG